MARQFDINLDPASEYAELRFLVLKENMDASIKCFDKITKLLDKSKSIPTALFSEWQSYLLNPDDIYANEMNEKFHSIANDTISFFSKRKDYNVTGKNEEGKIEFRLNECIYATVKKYYNLSISGKKLEKLENLKKVNERDYVLYTIYDIFSRFTRPFDSPVKELFSSHRRRVIAAYITQKLGYKITTGKEIDTTKMQDRARNIIRSIEKKMEKRKK